ncbi:MAG: hypothetical protein KBS57_06035 [Alistipes sp.]|nr:hypothetical protein [Candidatus Minthomonas equi]
MQYLSKNILFICLFCALFSACRKQQPDYELIPISSKALFDTTSVWFGNFDTYPRDKSKLPIGIMISRVEEYIVLEKFLTADYFDNITGDESPDGIRDFAGEKFNVLLDYANSPYGNFYLNAESIDILRDITVRNALHLMDDDYFIIPEDILPTGIKDRVKVLVNVSDLPCLYAQGDLDSLLRLSRTGVESLNVISSGVKTVVASSEPGNAFAVGILSSTEQSQTGKYEETLRNAFFGSGFKDRVQIFNQVSYGLEGAIEGKAEFILPSAAVIRESYAGSSLGFGDEDIDVNMMDRFGFQTSGNALLFSKTSKGYGDIQLNSPGNYARFHLVTLIEKHRRSGSRIPIKSVILGDISSSLLLDTLKTVVSELYDFSRDGQYLYRNSISPDVVFIDPVECLVKECYRLLRRNRELSLNTSRTDVNSFITIPSPSLEPAEIDTLKGTFTDSFKLGREPGLEFSGEKVIPFSFRYISVDEFSPADTLFTETSYQIKKKLF